MDRTEATLIKLFEGLREDLREEYGVGLALKAEGQDITLRIRSRKNSGDEKQPFFALVVGERDGAFRLSYKPDGVPLAESRVTIVDRDSAGDLPGLIRGYLEAERRRLVEYRQGG